MRIGGCLGREWQQFEKDGDMMLLWIADMRTAPLAKDYECVLGALSAEDAERARRFVNHDDAVRSAVGALLLARMAARALGNGALPEIVRTEYGKPYVAGHPEVQLSLAHGGSIVVCVSADEPVGVDVEQVRPVDLADFDSWLTECEKQAIATSDDPVREFFRIWTAREAFAKRDGRGLALFDDPAVREGYRDAGCEFREVPAEGHVLTLCARRIPHSLRIEHLTPLAWHALLDGGARKTCQRHGSRKLGHTS